MTTVLSAHSNVSVCKNDDFARGHTEIKEGARLGPEAIDIIVPVYKNAALTERCLGSLAEHLHELAAIRTRVLLINDSPDDAEVAQVLNRFAQRHSFARVLRNDVNQGFVRAVNRGLALSVEDGCDVILVNSDTQTYPGTLAQLLATAQADPQIGFVSPRSNNASLCSLPHRQQDAIEPLAADAHECWRRISSTMPAFHFAPTAVGFYLYIKHVVLANLGLLDESFGVGYEEENDLIMRANKVGFRAALANHAYVYHAGGASFGMTSLDLSAHRAGNLQLMATRHAEFMPLLRRYEASAHFRAEGLLGQAISGERGKPRIVFDLSGLGCDYNGTNEFSVGVLSALCRQHGAEFDFHIICSELAFRFHGLDAHADLRRHDIDAMTNQRFAIGVRFGQPFELRSILALNDLAAANIYCMLDTIAEDCGYLAAAQPLDQLWESVARHANGIAYISRFSERSFVARFPDAADRLKYTRLLPTRLSEYRRSSARGPGSHVMIMGNHFAHKASSATAALLSRAFPSERFAMLGSETGTSGNVSSYKAGLLAEAELRALYDQARVVVLPSYIEGFGFGLVHSLAAGRVIVARDIPATREILATYLRCDGVFLYQDEAGLVSSLRQALTVAHSEVDDSEAHTWDDWAQGFARLCRQTLSDSRLFPHLVERLRACELLQKAMGADALAAPIRARGPVVCRSLKQLLALDGEEFVRAAYGTIFHRHPDSEGLEHYVMELDAGVSKLAVVSRLRDSEEGRAKNLPLAGFRRAHITQRVMDLGKPRSGR
jgi:GT2 family glycosyltransferase